MTLFQVKDQPKRDFDGDVRGVSEEQAREHADGPRRDVLAQAQETENGVGADADELDLERGHLDADPPGNRNRPHAQREHATAEHIETFLVEGLGMAKEFSKSELQLLFLDAAGIILNESALDELFALVDVDRSGLVSATELSAFVDGIHPSSKKERSKYVVWKTLTFPPFYLCLLNLAASLLAASTNLREREGGDLADSTNNPYWGIAAICDLVGNFGYVVLKYEEESLAYEGIQQARARLIKWVKVDLPRFMQIKQDEQEQTQKKLATSSMATPPPKEATTAKSKLIRRLSSLSRFSLDSIGEDVSVHESDREGGNAGTNVEVAPSRQEQSGVFMASIAVGTVDCGLAMDADVEIKLGAEENNRDAEKGDSTSISTEGNHSSALLSIRSAINHRTEEFRKGDVDDSDDGLDLHEMRLLLESMGVFLPELVLREVFYEVDADHSGRVSINEFQAYANRQLSDERTSSAVRRCGCVRQKHVAVLDRCLQALGFWTGWCFVLGACFWVVFSHMDLPAEYFRQFVGLTCFFYLCGAMGNLSNVYDSTSVTFWQLDNADVMLRAAAISAGKAAEDNVEVADLAEKESLSRRDQRLLLQSIRHSAMKSKRDVSSHRSKKDKKKGSQEENDRKTQELGARLLFQIMDISQDSNVDETELFDALSDLGVLIPVHTFQQLFSRVDKSGDGNVDVDEFIQYIIAIEPSMSARAQVRIMVDMMVRQASFYLVLVQVTAGFLQTIAAYSLSIPSDRTKNMFLCGSCCWAIGSIYFLMRWPKNFGGFFDQMEQNKFMIKAAVLDESQEFWRQKDAERGKTTADGIVNGEEN